MLRTATMAYMERRSLVSYIDKFLRWGDGCAYVQARGYRLERWSYRRVAEASFQFARELASRGIGKGDRILLWGPNRAEWVSAFFGCVLRGVIVVPMDDVATPDFATRVFQQVSAKLLVCSRNHLQQPLPTVILDDLVSQDRSPDPYQPAVISPEDILEVVFTSGTTAEPKGVMISHANVLGNIEPLETEIRKYLKYERWVHPVRFLNLLPLSHVFGQFLGIFLPPLMGGTVIFQDSLKPSEVMQTVRGHRVSVIVAVPRLLQSLKEKVERDLQEEGHTEDFQKRFRSSEGKHFLLRWWIFRRIHRRFGWKFWAFICGGAALDSVTEEFWGRMGYAVVQGYGLTETTSLISLNHPFRLGKGSIGKVLAGREVKLSPDGEILVRGSGVASGYWKTNGVQPVAGNEGWYPTGDIGEIDAAGNLFFKGRKKDVIVTPAGMNIYPEDLESALRRQPGVKDAIIVPLPRDGNAEPCAVLLLHEDAQPDPIVEAANRELAEYQRLHTWFVWPDEDFPRTATQKPRTNLIAQTVEEGLSGKASSSSNLAELLSRVAGREARGISATSNLDNDLNLSSLDRVQLLGAIEDRYQVDLNETRFAALKTVGDLERMLHGTPPGRTSYHYASWVQRWPMSWIRILIQNTLLVPATYILGWPRILGRDNLREVRGPVLVVSNHIDDIDIGLVLTALPARLRNRLATATAGEALEALHTPPASRNILGRLFDRLTWVLGVSLLNLFPLPREAGFRQSFSYAGEAVDRGYSILIFPEGRHTKDGNMLPFRAGIGMLVNNLRVPVVPVRIRGWFELKQAGKRIAKPHAITINIGRPLQFEPDTDAQKIADDLKRRVEEL